MKSAAVGRIQDADPCGNAERGRGFSMGSGNPSAYDTLRTPSSFGMVATNQTEPVPSAAHFLCLLNNFNGCILIEFSNSQVARC